MSQSQQSRLQRPILLNEIGKIPPQSIEMEEAVLGGLLLESNAIDEVVDILKPESFYCDEHQRIYIAIITLYNSGKPIDLLTVSECLSVLDNLDLIGGISRLSELTQNVGSAAHIEYHARIIQQKFIQRELIRISSEIQNKAFDDSVDVSDLIEFAEKELFSVVNGNIQKDFQTLAEIGKIELQEIEKIYKSQVEFTGIPSGFTSIDKYTSGWQLSDLIIIAGRPSMGKTAFALTQLKNICIDFGKKGAIFSLEMSAGQLWRRITSDLTGIENGKLRSKFLTTQDWNDMESAQAKIEKANIFVDDTPGISLIELRAKARKLKMKFGIDILFIDYLQLMQGAKESRGNRESQVSEISRGLKILARELDIPIICLSQLNRSVETRGGDKRPQLSDLRESGAIEQDADIVAFVHRPEYYGIMEYEDNTSTVNIVEILIKKHRNGALADVILKRTSNFSRISDLNDDNIPEIKPNEAF